MLCDEVVVVEMWIGCMHAVDLLDLAGAEGLILMETPDAFEQALAAQDFMQTGDAALESVRRVEERRITVCDLDAEAQQLWRGIGSAALLQQFDRTACPHRPVAEQSADDATLFAVEAKRREKIDHDAVVVAGVEHDIVAPGLDHGADDVDGLVAAERRDFDSHDVFDFHKTTPE